MRTYVIRRYACDVDAEPATRHLTFLFADVEGSTRLVEHHGTDAGQALSTYHELVASHAVHRGGRLFERIGDGAYACFPDALAAVAAADDVQTAVAEHDWGGVGRIRIRIALVSGDVEEQGDRYYGRALFRAARLQALARGGETLLAGSTVAELDGALPPGTQLRDLGAQRLRDVAEPEGCSRWCILPAPVRATRPNPTNRRCR